MPYQGRIGQRTGTHVPADQLWTNVQGVGVNRQSQRDLAWALTDFARALLPKDVRAWVYARIGAGEQESAIRYVLHSCANAGTGLPADLHAQVSTWALGYKGSGVEDELNSLVSRIQVGVKSVRAALGDNVPPNTSDRPLTKERTCQTMLTPSGN